VILRPSSAPHAGAGPAPVWERIEATQRSGGKLELVPQASHAVLAGVLAQNLAERAAPALDDAVIQGIALHDIGWTALDYEILLGQRPAISFLDETPAHFVCAWTDSINAAQGGSPIAGLIVSRHFSRLAEFRQAEQKDTGEDARQIADFLAAEAKRQEQLFGDVSRSVEEVEALVDVLQFCDVVSLYLCCGDDRPARLPELCGRRYQVDRRGQEYRFTPELLADQVDASFPVHSLDGSGGAAARRDVQLSLR
jgi:hypothetical protein